MNAMAGGAPRFWAAFMYAGEMPFITLYTGRIMKGSRIWTMTITVPVKLYIIGSRFSSSTTWSATRVSFTTPSCCSMIIHATMRTSSDVQKGISTQINSKLE